MACGFCADKWVILEADDAAAQERQRFLIRPSSSSDNSTTSINDLVFALPPYRQPGLLRRITPLLQTQSAQAAEILARALPVLHPRDRGGALGERYSMY